MKKLMSSICIAVGLSAGFAGYALAHSKGETKKTAEECKKLLDADLQKECTACVGGGKKHFHPGEPAGKRCMDNEEPKKEEPKK